MLCSSTCLYFVRRLITARLKGGKWAMCVIIVDEFLHVVSPSHCHYRRILVINNEVSGVFGWVGGAFRGC